MEAGVSPKLTDRQRDVIERIDRRMSIKQIANDLGVSETRINQHIRALKTAFGVESLPDLVETYRLDIGRETIGRENTPYRNPEYRKKQLTNDPDSQQSDERADPGELVFADAQQFTVEAPWSHTAEPRIVPGVLDGRHAVIARLAVMTGIAFGVVALVVLVVTASLSMSEALDGTAAIPVEKNSPSG